MSLSPQKWCETGVTRHKPPRHHVSAERLDRCVPRHGAAPAPTPHAGKAPPAQQCRSTVALVQRNRVEVQEKRNFPAELKQEHTGCRLALSRAHPCDKCSQASTVCLPVAKRGL